MLPLMLALLMTAAGNAEAMICESEEQALEEERWSSQLMPQPSPVEAAVARKTNPVPQRCESFGDTDCDLGIPDGAPSTPKPLKTRRPTAALASAPLAPRPPQCVTLGSRKTAHTNSSDFIKSIFRPPRRS